VTLLEEVAVVGASDAAARHGRDYRGFSGGEERLDHPRVGIIGLVGQQGVGLHFGQEGVGALQIMSLAGRQQKPQRVAQRIDEGMDLGAQSAPAEPDGFVVPRLFLRAPALCW
jgi:hypothetical protein